MQFSTFQTNINQGSLYSPTRQLNYEPPLTGALSTPPINSSNFYHNDIHNSYQQSYYQPSQTHQIVSQPPQFISSMPVKDLMYSHLETQPVFADPLTKMSSIHQQYSYNQGPPVVVQKIPINHIEGDYQLDQLMLPGFGTFKRYSLKKRAYEDNQIKGQSNEKKMTNREFFLSLIESARLEAEVEAAKINLSKNFDFNLPFLWLIFDENNSGCIVPKEFDKGLKSLGVEGKTEEIAYLIRRMKKDRLNDGKIDGTQDFEFIFIPQFEKIRDDCRQFRNIGSFSTNTVINFQQLMKAHFKNENYFANLCRRIQRSKTDVAKIAQEIDTNKSGNINIQELTAVLKKYSSLLSQQQTACLFKRFDKNDNGLISYQEFVEEFLTFFTNLVINNDDPLPLTAWQKQFYDSLYQCALYEEQIEDLKIKICQQQDFNMCYVADYFAGKFQSDQYIDLQEFLMVLIQELNIQISLLQAFLLFRRAFSAVTDKIHKTDLYLLFLPTLEKYNNRIINEQYKQKITQRETGQLLKEILKLHLMNEGFFSQIRVELNKVPNGMLIISNEIDDNKTGATSVNEFNQVMKKYGKILSQRQLLLLFARFDRQKQGLIKNEDIKYELQLQKLNTKMDSNIYNSVKK